MTRSSNLIPEFMIENPDDVFEFLFPLKLFLDEDKFGNSHYEVVVKNITKNEVFSYQLSPELLFTYYPLGKQFKNGSLVHNTNNYIFEKDFIIDTTLIDITKKDKLKDFLDDKTITMLLGWNNKYLNIARYINCHILEQDNIKIIIPHYVLGIYYYFRFSELREAVLDINIENLYVTYNDNYENANIVLPKQRNDEDAVFIYRYAIPGLAKREFENIGQYIHHYLNYMRKNDIDSDIGDVHLRINFPTNEKFRINTRMSKLKNQKTGEEYYYIHEIINDYSSIGCNKLTKIIQDKSVITNTENLGNLPKIDKDIPLDTNDILKVIVASKKYTSTFHRKDKKTGCGSLENVEIDHATIEKDIIENILKIYLEQMNDEAIFQSLTESSRKGDKKTRKAIISSEYLETIKNKIKPEVDNFVIFKQYTNFLQKLSAIENFQLNEVQELREFIDSKTKKVNPKCKIYKRARQYLTATFKYESYYVGILELETYSTSSASSWIIISKSQISIKNFDFFIQLYFEDKIPIVKLLEDYKNTDPKFTKKNHERSENLSDESLAKWYAGLLGKICL